MLIILQNLPILSAKVTIDRQLQLIFPCYRGLFTTTRNKKKKRVKKIVVCFC